VQAIAITLTSSLVRAYETFIPSNPSFKKGAIAISPSAKGLKSRKEPIDRQLRLYLYMYRLSVLQ